MCWFFAHLVPFWNTIIPIWNTINFSAAFLIVPIWNSLIPIWNNYCKSLICGAGLHGRGCTVCDINCQFVTNLGCAIIELVPGVQYGLAFCR